MPKDKPKKPKVRKKAKAPKGPEPGMEGYFDPAWESSWATTTGNAGYVMLEPVPEPKPRERRIHVTLYLSLCQWQFWPLHRWLWRTKESFCVNGYLGPLRLEVRKS